MPRGVDPLMSPCYENSDTYDKVSLGLDRKAPQFLQG